MLIGATQKKEEEKEKEEEKKKTFWGCYIWRMLHHANLAYFVISGFEESFKELKYRIVTIFKLASSKNHFTETWWETPFRLFPY